MSSPDSKKSGAPRPSLVSDVRRLYKHAAVIGFLIGLVCHLLPPEHRAVCEALAQLCGR
jgi:hypothetical protein